MNCHRDADDALGVSRCQLVRDLVPGPACSYADVGMSRAQFVRDLLL